MAHAMSPRVCSSPPNVRMPPQRRHPRAGVDCFIVQCVLETDGILLHRDVDFEKIKAVRPLPWPVR